MTSAAKEICFIGNSHLIMIQKAWMESGGSNAFNATFFASLVKYFEELAMVGGKLESGKGKLNASFERSAPETHGVIDLLAYDKFVVVGMSVGIINFYRLIKTYYITEVGLPFGDQKRLLSKHFTEAWAREVFEDSAAMKVVKLLREQTDKPIFLVPQPAPSIKLMNQENGQHLPPSDSEFYRHIEQMFENSLQYLSEKYDLVIIDQSNDTKVKAGFTESSYTEGAVSFVDKKFGESDVGHMNAGMGRKYLEEIMSYSL